jgi:hypothetical protein
MAAICEICSTLAPDLLNRNGRAVQIKPMYMPRGRISTPNAHGAGHPRIRERPELIWGSPLSGSLVTRDAPRTSQSYLHSDGLSPRTPARDIRNSANPRSYHLSRDLPLTK